MKPSEKTTENRISEVSFDKAFYPDPNTGLTSEMVKKHRQYGWDNMPVNAESKSIADIIKGNVLTYFNLIFVILAILLIIVGSFRDLTFLVVIIANTLIGIIQELNAKRALEKLSMLNAPKTSVLRNGKIKVVLSEHLVYHDIVLFKAGNQIPADAVVMEGEVTVNESLLTGESDEIHKRKGDSLLSGSFIVSGTCKAMLDHVGENSYISKLTLEAKSMKDNGEQSQMVRSINKLVAVIGIIIIPIGLILFLQSFVFAHASLKDSVQSMVSAVIGMIPEGLYLLTSITLAAGVVKLAAKKVLVHDMKCIETLARVNVLCVDKTGTITETAMKVHKVIPAEQKDGEEPIPYEELLASFVYDMPQDNATMAALQERFAKQPRFRATRIFPFSSQFKYSAVELNGNSFVCGAPEFILGSHFHKYRQLLTKYSYEGYRVLAFGHYPLSLTGKQLTADVTPICFILLSNPIRKDAKKTFSYFRKQGVEIKVISGDNPITVSKVAMEAGIPNAERYIDASLLRSDEALYKAASQYSVFGRVTPNQKRQLVRALKDQGNTVAMTGDGVNDVLALKDADCSVAMASGSDAASQASQLVLLESDFSRMPDIVAEGRQIVNNLERSGSLFLVKNIFTLITAIFSIICAVSFPVQPSQLTMIAFFTIGMPGLFLSQMPNTKRIEGRFISNILLKALPAGLTDAIIVCLLVIFGLTFNVDALDISTAATILLAIVGFMILYQISKPMDKYRWWIWIGCVGCMIFALFFLRDLFGITGMSVQCVMLFVLFSIATEPIFRYLSKLTNFVRLKLHNWKEEKEKSKKGKKTETRK